MKKPLSRFELDLKLEGSRLEMEKSISDAVLIPHYEVERIFLKRLRDYRNHSKDEKFVECVDYIARKVYGDKDFTKYITNNANLEVGA